MIASFSTLASAASYNFTDINSHWAKDSIRFVCNTKEVMKGTSSTTFSPDTYILRRDVVLTFANVRHVSLNNNLPSGFSDVPQNMYYTGAVRWAKNKGIVNGDGNSNFNPNARITRQDVAVMMYRFGTSYSTYNFPNNYPNKSYLSYSDYGNISSYARDAISALSRAGIIQGDSQGNFSPQSSVSRAEVATLLANFFNKANGDNITIGQLQNRIDDEFVNLMISEAGIFNPFTVTARYIENYYLTGSNVIYPKHEIYVNVMGTQSTVTDIICQTVLPSHVSMSSWNNPPGGEIYPGGAFYHRWNISTERKNYPRENNVTSALKISLTASNHVLNPWAKSLILNLDPGLFSN